MEFSFIFILDTPKVIGMHAEDPISFITKLFSCIFNSNFYLWPFIKLNGGMQWSRGKLSWYLVLEQEIKIQAKFLSYPNGILLDHLQSWVASGTVKGCCSELSNTFTGLKVVVSGTQSPKQPRVKRD